MRIMWVVACSLVAVDCFEKAAGLSPQSIFSNDALWIWDGAAFLWLVTAVITLLGADE